MPVSSNAAWPAAHPDLQVGQYPEGAAAVVQHPLHAVFRQPGASGQRLPALAIELAQSTIDRGPQPAVTVLAEVRHHADRHALVAAVVVQLAARNWLMPAWK
jgi:hypothetical protein